jgi:hypothetical protein
MAEIGAILNWWQRSPGLIGGGIVVQRFGNYSAGTRLTGDEIRRMRNFRQLIEYRRIDVWPADANRHGLKRFVIPRGGPGKYAVVEGQVLNSEPLSKEDALALAKGTAPEKDAEAAAA